MRSIHDIEGRRGSVWLKRAKLHLLASVDADVDDATDHALSLVRSVLEDVTADEDAQRAWRGLGTR